MQILQKLNLKIIWYRQRYLGKSSVKVVREPYFYQQHCNFWKIKLSFNQLTL